MRSKKAEAFIMLFCGQVCIAAAGCVYFVAHTIYPNSDSARVRDLNGLLKTFDKTGTAIIIGMPGLIAVYTGVKKLQIKK